MTDLEKMFEWYKQELKDFNELTNLEFLLKYEYNFKDEIIKDYKVYMKDNEDEDPSDLLAYDEWIEEYQKEVSDELIDKVMEYFTSYDIEEYKSKDNYIIDLLLALGGPNIYLRVESKWNKVTWKWYWGWEEIKEDLSQFYYTIETLYNLDN